MKEPCAEFVYFLISTEYGAELLYPIDSGSKTKGLGHRIRLDAELAYATVKYWPDHEFYEAERGEDDEATEWVVALVEPSVEDGPEIKVRSDETIEQAISRIEAMNAFFKASMKPEDVAGLSAFRRMHKIWERYWADQDAREKSRKIKAERDRVIDERNARRAQAVDPASELFDAILLARNGVDFTTTMVSGYSGDFKEVKSSMKAALKMLADPTRPLKKLCESENHRGDGTVYVEIGLTRDKFDFPTVWLNFHAPPISVLKTQSDMKRDVVDPKTPKKTMRTRTDTI